jgi:hypothetical protein
MFSAILALLLLPVTDVSRSRGMQFRPLSKITFYVFIANFLILMQLGAKHVESPFIEFGQISTLIYFSFFTLVVYSATIVENTFVGVNSIFNTINNTVTSGFNFMSDISLRLGIFIMEVMNTNSFKRIQLYVHIFMYILQAISIYMII